MIQILLEIMEAQFVPILVFSIFLTVDLNSIISQMHKSILIFNMIIKATCSDVPIIIPVSLYGAVLCYQKGTRRTRSM